MACIIVISGPREGDYYPLGRRVTVIGRDVAVPAQILDERVSRRHLQIRYDRKDGKYHAVDMKSTHGTYINNRRITKDTVLTDSDRIVIGRTGLLFTIKDFPNRESALNHWKKVGERHLSTIVAPQHLRRDGPAADGYPGPPI